MTDEMNKPEGEEAKPENTDTGAEAAAETTTAADSAADTQADTAAAGESTEAKPEGETAAA